MTDLGLIDLLIALAIGAGIWMGARFVIRVLTNPPPEPSPDEVMEVDQSYKCTVCGAEVTMTVQNVHEASAPRHCREEMVPVWRPSK